MSASWLVVGLLATAFVANGKPVDRTREPGAAGAEVVDAVVRLIDESGIFPDDARFLRRLAYVESGDGSDERTYRADYNGGIWQVRHEDPLKLEKRLSIKF